MNVAMPVSRMSKVDAVMAIAVAAAVADGRLEARELVRLRLMAHISPLFRYVPDVDVYLEAIGQELQSLGSQCFVERAAASLDTRLSETAYAWAAEIVMADDRIQIEEADFLENLRRTLGIHPTLASKIRAVLALRGRGE